MKRPVRIALLVPLTAVLVASFVMQIIPLYQAFGPEVAGGLGISPIEMQYAKSHPGAAIAFFVFNGPFLFLVVLAAIIWLAWPRRAAG